MIPAPSPRGPLHVVVPADLDDPHRPSGGNVYDRRVVDGLRVAGWTVHEQLVTGAWPRPTDTERAELAGVLAAIPDGGDVLLDGLVACGVPDVLAPHAGRLRLVVLVHLPLGDERGLSDSVAAALTARERVALQTCAGVVATSRWTASRLADLHGLHRRHVHVAEPGVDPAPIAPLAPEGLRLLCVGSLTPTKGQDLLVDALADLAGREDLAEHAWTCRLVGPLTRDPLQVVDVQSRIERFGLEERILVEGPLTGPALASAYATADLLVVPSRAETYGMVVTEALARGIPVLATDVGGLRATLGGSRLPEPRTQSVTGEMVDADAGLPGVLVPPRPQPLADALAHWLTDAAHRTRLRSAAASRRPVLHGWEVTTRCLAHALTPTRTPA